MLRSMTGYGSAEGQCEGIEYAIEVRSVNNRYLKVAIKAPDAWNSAESDVEKLIRSRITRGTVYLAIRMRLPHDKAACRVNLPVVSAYLDQLRELEVEANPTLRIDLGTLLQLPGATEVPELTDLCEQTRDGLFTLIEQALERMVEMRDREGLALAAELRKNCEEVSRATGAVEKRAPQVVQGYHDRLRERVAELTRAASLNLDAEILAREVAVFAERCDVEEELARLKAHVEHFLAAMEGPDAAGRKLEFIAQEMLREANTIASKGNDAEIARIVVEMKTAIDRIKEQVQNVE